VVGVTGFFDPSTKRMTAIGIQCSLCHSTVDDSLTKGIGRVLDGWPNRDLDVGTILANAPGLADFAQERGVEMQLLRDAYASWGPGRYDARFNIDLQSAPVLIPPAYGLADVPLVTYTGDGGISYWNAYVAVTQMGGQGRFGDPALGLDIDHEPDLVTRKLPALRAYQHQLEPPTPTAQDPQAVVLGEDVFFGVAQCAGCHSGDSFTDAPVLHGAWEVGMDPVEAQRGKTGRYRTTPLRGAWSHPPYFHDGSAANFGEVINHYEDVLDLQLDAQQRSDLIAYLRSL
jgi:mono/diheme cytochrome c family protein